MLSSENLEYLSQVPCRPVAHDGFQLVHGSPLDEDQYLLTAGDVAQLLPDLGRQLTLFGHTHVQGGFLASQGGVRGEIDPEGAFQIETGLGVYLVNPGSVGQPRDGDWRAAYALYSPDERLVEFARVPDPVGKTAEKIALAGLQARLLLGEVTRMLAPESLAISPATTQHAST